MNTTETHLPIPEQMERYDGSVWRAFHTQDGTHIVMTQRGLELFRFNPGLRKSILDYRDEADPLNTAHGRNRNFFKAGGNGDVYTLGQYPLLIKESFSQHSLWSALDRMDYLHGVCLRHLPSYVRVPDQYGVLLSRKSTKEYLMMSKINEGLTVADIINGHPIDPKIKDMVLSAFSPLKSQVEAAIKSERQYHEIPFNLLPDWDAGNTLVDFGTKTKMHPFTFWIIDQ